MNSTTNTTTTTIEDDHSADRSSSSSDKPWGDIVLACFTVQLVTLSGVFLAVATRFCVTKHKPMIEKLLVPGFAAGALLATAAFLLLPEALSLLIEAAAHAEEAAHSAEEEEAHHFLRHLEEVAVEEEEEDHSGENGVAWKFGASLLGGFLLPLLLHTLVPPARVIVDECEDCQQQGEEIVGLSSAAKELVEEEEDGETKNVQDSSIDMRTMESGCDAHECKHPNHQSDAEKMETSLAFAIDEDAVAADETAPARHQPPVNFPLAISILLGDAIHNFTDGVFLGNSFLLCSRDIAWTMVATTIYHELAQELADYVLLTSHCGLPIWKALLANFLSGLSVLFGALVILAADLSDQATGVILAISAGVYLHITAVECLPRVMEITKAKRRLFLLFLGMFVLGAVPIGLVLLNHGHCA